MNYKLCTFLTSLFVLSAYAGPNIVGDYISDVPDQTCKITTKSQSLCSATLIASNFVLSARHCFDNDSKEDITVSCTVKHTTYKSKASKLSISYDVYDAAVLKLKTKMPIRPMPMVESRKNLKSDRTFFNRKCAVFGYGINNNGTKAKKYGVILDSVRPSEAYFDNIHLPAIINNRINNIGYIHKIMKTTSATDTLLYRVIKNSIINSTDLTVAQLESAAKKDPKGSDRFHQILNEQLKDIYQDELKSFQKKELNYILQTYHTSSRTKHTSGFLPGDSGGTLACKNYQGEWTLYGIISNTQIKKLNSKSYVAIKGGAVPLTGRLLKFIKNSLNNL